MMPTRPGSRSRPSIGSHRSTLSLQKTEITINVYDLLPPGRLSSVLWTIGASLLHTGVVINDKEYAYGGHDKRGVTGVYWTRPNDVPPGGTFKCSILHGFTLATPAEIEATLKETSDEFQGTSYNLLTRNCNHFTSILCKKLTGKSGPGWLNRAARIGVALPCIVPRDWLEPPDYETADGELLDEEDVIPREDTSMLRSSPPRLLSGGGSGSNEWDRRDSRSKKGSKRAKKPPHDSAGRPLPASERAPST